MKIDHSIRDVQDAEMDLAKQLYRLSDRHAADGGVHHLSRDLARRCEERLRQLGAHSQRYGVETSGHTTASSVLSTVRQATSSMVARTELAGMSLLADLRDTYLVAMRTELAWTILQQAAASVRDGELLNVAQQCREDTETCGKWLRTMVKTSAPQALAAG
jgi:hypothetical protein